MQDSVSCGFCIFNNVAIGAVHALQQHSSVIKKVAIIDIDIHHGNGTEEIVSKFEDPSKLFFFSIHLFDKEEVLVIMYDVMHETHKTNLQNYIFVSPPDLRRALSILPREW
jgi:acetoin utilization deacetylase AcuC-like enzyme